MQGTVLLCSGVSRTCRSRFQATLAAMCRLHTGPIGSALSVRNVTRRRAARLKPPHIVSTKRSRQESPGPHLAAGDVPRLGGLAPRGVPPGGPPR